MTDLIDRRQRLAACMLLSAFDLPANMTEASRQILEAAKVCPGVSLDETHLGEGRKAALIAASRLIGEMLSELAHVREPVDPSVTVKLPIPPWLALDGETVVRDATTGKPVPGPGSTELAQSVTLHHATAAALNGFMVAMAEKLSAAERKYGYSDGWKTQDWEEECRLHLRHHVEKGDPLDVAAYAMFCWARGWSTSSPIPAPVGWTDNDRQLVEQARQHIANTWTKQGWRAEPSNRGGYEVWTLDATGQRRIILAHGLTPNTAALMCFVSTALPQLCELADRFASLNAAPAAHVGGVGAVAAQKGVFLPDWCAKDILTYCDAVRDGRSVLVPIGSINWLRPENWAAEQTQHDLRHILKDAFVAGCCAVLTWTKSGMPQDDLDEAGYDYAAKVLSFPSKGNAHG